MCTSIPIAEMRNNLIPPLFHHCYLREPAAKNQGIVKYLMSKHTENLRTGVRTVNSVHSVHHGVHYGVK